MTGTLTHPQYIPSALLYRHMPGLSPHRNGRLPRRSGIVSHPPVSSVDYGASVIVSWPLRVRPEHGHRPRRPPLPQPSPIPHQVFLNRNDSAVTVELRARTDRGQSGGSWGIVGIVSCVMGIVSCVMGIVRTGMAQLRERRLPRLTGGDRPATVPRAGPPLHIDPLGKYWEPP